MELEKLAKILLFTEIGFLSTCLILDIYILSIIITTKIENSIEWRFTKICVTMDIIYTLTGTAYYILYYKYPDSVLVCQLGGFIKTSLYIICVVTVWVLMSIKFCKYFIQIEINEWIWYIVFASLVCYDLAMLSYFAISKKLRPTLMGYCFIDPLEGQISRYCILSIVILGLIAIITIISNYTFICLLGLKMGAYARSDEIRLEKNSIVEKSTIIVLSKAISIALTYLISFCPKLITTTYAVINLKSIGLKFDLISDFLISICILPNLLTIVLLNSVIRQRFFNFNKKI
jgi:hypothetical protein